MHRGLCERAVENSYKAFLYACKEPDVWGVETDIQFTKDGKCVCFHDKSTKRLMGIKRLVRELRFDEMAKYKLVGDNESVVADVCSFKKYVKICKKYNKTCVIEFKYDFSDKQLLHVLKTIKWHRYLKKCVFISFNTSVLIKLRRMLPKQPLELLVTNPVQRPLAFCVENRVDVSMHWRLIRKDTIKRYNDFGVKVAVWGVKGYVVALKLAKMGVESITTDKVM